MTSQTRKICILAAEFNRELIDVMVAEAADVLTECPDTTVDVVRVPGAYEIPIVADALASNPATDGIVVLGYIERGKTLHGEVMGHVVHSQLVDIQIRRKVAMGVGVIGPGATIEQARERHREYARAAAKSLIAVRKLLDADVRWHG